MTVEQKIDGQNDQFPVGMRVLAVDDDPTCLRVLDTLLRKCQYHVTTTSQAITALEMLRENKNKFDLVISDVHMPDMDGFKLLELVGLEMDLPVIMLSAYGDTDLVMKGISHGACDYLLKPIRIEELKNIWQHVIRRKKFDPKDQKDFDKAHVESGDLKEFQEMCGPDENGKINRKRKDQIDDEDEERDENGHNNEDPSAQKKPRVVWSVELHRKFVAAVNQLGIDKAVPKRILDLMNVEKLTRENVASHLQKYRLYLKRISCVTSQQANIVAALGNADSAYLRMASLNGLGNLPTLDGSAQFQNAAFGSFRPSSSVLGRLNSPAGLGMRNLSSSGMVQFGHAQNSSNPVNGLANFHSLSQSGNQNGNILYGMPMSLELDQLQHNQGVNHVGVLPVNDSMMYPISSGFSETKINVGSSSNPHFSISDDFSDTKINVGSSSNSLFGMPNLPNNSLMVDGNLQDAHRRRVLRNQSSVTTSSLNSGFSSHLPDIERCNNNWPNAVQSSEVHSNLYTLNDCFKQTNPGILRDTGPSMMHMGNDSHDVSSINLAPAQYADGKLDILQCQAGSGSSGIGQNINVTLQQGWDDSKQDAYHQSYLLNSSVNSLLPHDVASPFNSSLMRSNNELWKQL